MNIDELQAGRELDVLVAVNVMGFADRRDTTGSDLADFYMSIPAYSTDIAAAWQVVKKLIGEHQICFELEDYSLGVERWKAMFKCELNIPESRWNRLVYSIADTAELAICRAALKVVTNER